MSLVEHYKIVEIDVAVITTACTINGNPGYGTPITCLDQKDTFTSSIRTYPFTDTPLILPVSGVFKQLKSVAETTPILKAGRGVASRATAIIMFDDFKDDPNLDSPALVANPNLRSSGTYFGKMNERSFLINNAVRVQYWERKDGVDTKIKTNHYIITEFKRTKNNLWRLTAKDVLYKTNEEIAQFPKVVSKGSNRLTASISAVATSITFGGDVADWDATKHIAVLGEDLLPISNVAGSSTSVTLTVTRPTSIVLGSRTFINVPEAHDDEDGVFRGRFFVDASIDDIIFSVLRNAELVPSEFDAAQISSELNNWLSNIENKIDCIFYEPEDAEKVLNRICQEFLIDMWTDLSVGKVKVSGTSTWATSVATLTEGKEITYDSLTIDEPENLQFSRCLLQYDKRKLTANNNDVNFPLNSVAGNFELEGDDFYGREKLKKLGKSIILSNSTSNIESADLTTIRFAQRFSNRPKTFTWLANEKNLTYDLSDVVTVVSADNQDIDGSPKQGVVAQIIQIAPRKEIGRVYQVKAISYIPFSGGVDGSDFEVVQPSDNNLYTIIGGNNNVDTYTFIFDGSTYGQNTFLQAINIGSIANGSTINIVCINGALLTCKGGIGGSGGGLSGNSGGDGGDGGIVINNSENKTVTVNIYLNGVTPDFGNGTYSADGFVKASGGGGGGGDGGGSPTVGGGGGGGGEGSNGGNGGSGGTATEAPGNQGNNGTSTNPGNGGTGGEFEPFGGKNGSKGGNFGDSGVNNANGGNGGLAGKGLSFSAGTMNVITNGATSRLINGNGTTPTSLT